MESPPVTPASSKVSLGATSPNATSSSFGGKKLGSSRSFRQAGGAFSRYTVRQSTGNLRRTASRAFPEIDTSVLRMAELSDGGMLTHLLWKEFYKEDCKKAQRASQEEFFKWFIRRRGRVNPEACPEARHVARERLTRMLQLEVLAFWEMTANPSRSSVDVRMSTVNCAEDGVATPKGPEKPETPSMPSRPPGQALALFQAKAVEARHFFHSRKALHAGLAQLQARRQREQGQPEMFASEGPDTLSEWNGDFWTRYHRDDRKLVKPAPGRSRSKTTSGMQRSVSDSGTPEDSRLPSKRDGQACRLSKIALGGGLLPGNDPLKDSPSASSSWPMDAHSRHKRSSGLAQFSLERRSTSSLPKIAPAMRTIATSLDTSYARKEIPPDPTDPFGGMTQVDIRRRNRKEALHPVIGFSEGFSSPQAPSHDRSLSAADRGISEYIRTCHKKGVIPVSATLTMAMQNRIETRHGTVLTDNDLHALTAMVKQLDRLETVDFRDGCVFSDEVLTHFLQKLFGRPAADSLTELYLSGCRGARHSSCSTIIALMTEPGGLQKLRHLDLNGIALPSNTHRPLSEAIKNHRSLRSLNVANTGLGHGGDKSAIPFIKTILRSPRIEELDLSWNCFGEVAFRALGEAILTSEGNFTSLSVAQCTGSRTTSGEAPVSILLECLSSNRTLRFLDISSNMVDPEAALVLEDAFMLHSGLHTLQMNSNPCGSVGLRSCLRLLSREKAGLRNLICEDCVTIVETDSGGSKLRFDLSNPMGAYVFQLNRTYDRAVLRMVYKTCECFGLSYDSAFRGIEYSEGTYSHPSKDAMGVHVVPSSGTLRMTFSLDEAMVKLFNPPPLKVGAEKAPPPKAASDFLRSLREKVCVRPGSLKVWPLLHLCRKKHGKEEESKRILEALTGDFALESHLLSQIYRMQDSSAEVVANLLPCLVKCSVPKFLTLQPFSSIEEFFKTVGASVVYLRFNPENPTGHYKLNLNRASERAVATAVFLLDRWEAMQVRHAGRPDISMYGDWCNIRNCHYENAHVKSVTEFLLPWSNTLEFDFVTWRRMPPNTKALSEVAYNKMEYALWMTSCSQADKGAVLKRLSDQFWVTSFQLRNIICGFPDLQQRQEVMALFYLRMTDPQNQRVVWARIASMIEWEAMRQKLGMMVMFPFYQPEQICQHLTLSRHEDRLATSIFRYLSLRENPGNVRNPSLVLPDGTVKEFTAGMSPSWENYDEIPQEGYLSFMYECSADDRNLALRTELGKQYNGYSVDATIDKVFWWRSVNEVPEELLNFVYHGMRDFANPNDLFYILKGKGKPGNLSLAEMLEAMQSMGWTYYMENNDRVRDVFRLLDADGGGELSLLEWYVIRCVWRELQLSLIEFCQHLEHHFGGDMEKAWIKMDLNGDARIDKVEWDAAVSAAGYFSQAAGYLFRLIADEEGIITQECWTTKLKVAWDNRDEIREIILKGDQD